MSDRKQLLMIDDDPDFVDGIKSILTAAQYDVDVAHNPKDGLAALQKKQYDLLLLDIMMGRGAEGVMIARKMSRDPKLREIPVLIMTGIREQIAFLFGSQALHPHFVEVDELHGEAGRAGAAPRAPRLSSPPRATRQGRDPETARRSRGQDLLHRGGRQPPPRRGGSPLGPASSAGRARGRVRRRVHGPHAARLIALIGPGEGGGDGVQHLLVLRLVLPVHGAVPAGDRHRRGCVRAQALFHLEGVDRKDLIGPTFSETFAQTIMRSGPLLRAGAGAPTFIFDGGFPGMVLRGGRSRLRLIGSRAGCPSSPPHQAVSRTFGRWWPAILPVDGIQ